MPKTKTARKIRYEPVLQLPPLSYEEFTALRDNIAVNGVLVPILVDSDGPRRKIIDGNFRKQIANELATTAPKSSSRAWTRTKTGVGKGLEPCPATFEDRRKAGIDC